MVQFKSICEGDFNYDIEKLNTSIAWSRKETLKWDDLNTYATCLTQYSDEASELIVEILRFEPPSAYVVVMEPFIRSLLNQYHHNCLSAIELFERSKDHLFYSERPTPDC